MSRGRAARPSICVALTVALLASACGGNDDDDPGRATPAVLRVVAGGQGAGEASQHEYQFDLPADVPTGITRVALTNEGDEAHHAQLFRLNRGSTVEDLSAAIAEGGPPAALAHGEYVGGTSVVAPGSDSRADALVDLEPGDYAFICFVADATGTPHVAHGMIHPFSVTSDGAAVDPPPVDVTAELFDYGFELPESLDGDEVLSITDRAELEPHEMSFALLDDGAGVEEVRAALAAGEAVPATPVGGLQAILPGATQLLQLDLDPGRYVVMCSVHSPDGVPHHMKGMLQEVTVT
jgi:hypothetical protein